MDFKKAIREHGPPSSEMGLLESCNELVHEPGRNFVPVLHYPTFKNAAEKNEALDACSTMALKKSSSA